MKRLLGISGVIALLLLAGAVNLLFAQSSAKKSTSSPGRWPASAAGSPTNVQAPEHVVYEFYFRRMAFFDDIAKKRGTRSRMANTESDARNLEALVKVRNAAKSELKINEEQKAILEQVAANALGRAAALDAQAEAIIKRSREQFDKNKLNDKGGGKFPASSLELIKLQAERDAIFKEAKESLAKQMTAGEFTKIDSTIKSIIVPLVKVSTVK